MKKFVNLLPWKCRRMQIIRLRALQWSMPCAIAAAAVGLLGAAEWSRYRAAETRVEELEQNYAPVVSLGAQIKTQRTRVDELAGHAARVGQLETSRPTLTLLGLVSQSARECEGTLHVDTLSIQPAGDPAKKAAKTASDADSGTVVAVKGIAADNLAVTRFVAALRQTKAFRRVDLKSTQEQPYGANRACSYLVECGY
jgi:Tfp pilus assembly protein PilN